MSTTSAHQTIARASAPRRRSSAWIVAAMLLVSGLAACGASSADVSERFSDVPFAPDSETYSGPAKDTLETRAALLAEVDRGLEIGASRIEILPEGITWEEHLEWRADNVGDRVPADLGLVDDSDVTQAVFESDDDVLFVLGTIEDDRLVVYSALASE